MIQFYRIGRCAILALLTLCFVSSCKKDGTTKFKSTQKQLLSFKIDNISGKINDTNHTISIMLPYATDLIHVKPVITVSEKAMVTPASGTEVDLSNAKEYKVQAEDGTIQTYTVTATKGQNASAGIVEFKIRSNTPIDAGFTGVIDETAHTITFKVPFSLMKVNSLPTAIKIADGATITPAANDTIDFTSPVIYKVKSQSGVEQEYTVSVLNNQANLDVALPLPGEAIDNGMRWGYGGYGTNASVYPEDIAGIEDKHYIIVYILDSEDVSNMVFKKVNLSVGATISPAVDVPQNFNKDITYTVTSQSGDKLTYVVRCIKRTILTQDDFYTSIYNKLDANGSATIYYYCIGDLQQVWLVNEETNAVLNCTVGFTGEKGWGPAYSVFTIDEKSYPAGKYLLKVKLSDGNTVLTRIKFSL
jgi:hypothetical protein